MYLREADQPDRYADVTPLLHQQARYIDDVFALSSMTSGGGKRVRWVTNNACDLSILNVVLPDGAITGTHQTTETALKNAGHLQPNRKYLAFADVPTGGLSAGACGAATVYSDSNPTNNLNDGRYPQMARIDLECWNTDPNGRSVPLHELLHTLGAVQGDAPHAKSGGHCTDGADVMCYGGDVLPVCPDHQAFDIDCNDDDYFNLNPDPGSYLDTHWNTANSAFLADAPALPAPPSLTITPNNTSPTEGDAVVYTATVDEGTTVQWTTNAPSCQPNGAETTGPTYTLQCFESGGTPTVYAEASRADRLTTALASHTNPFGDAPSPVLEVSGPINAAAGSTFTLTASVTNAKTTTWTYRWTLPESCTATGSVTEPTLSASCSTVADVRTFRVTATRAEDGTAQSVSKGIRITAAGTPSVEVEGPETVLAGSTGTFTATVTNGEALSYQWSSQQGFAHAQSANTFTVRPPTITPYRFDTVFLTVTTTTGSKMSVTLAYEIVLPLNVTISGPTTMRSGATADYTATPTQPGASIKWTDTSPVCAMIPASGATSTLTCPDGHTGDLSVSAQAISSETGESATTTMPVSVTPPAVGTRIATTTSGTYPTTLNASLRKASDNSALPNLSVRLERRYPGGSYAVVATATTQSTGIARFSVKVTRGAYYRVRFVGDANVLSSVSAERYIKAYTRTIGGRTSTGLYVKVVNGASAPIARSFATLYARRVGTTRWVKMRAYRTNTRGTYVLRINPARATDYKWLYSGTSSYLPSRSGAVRLR